MPQGTDGEMPQRPEGGLPEQAQGEDGAGRQRPSDGSAQGSSGSSAARGGQNANTKGSVPDGFRTVTVEVGLSDDNNVEIISGLNEGDIVLLPDKTSSTTTTQQQGMPRAWAVECPVEAVCQLAAGCLPEVVAEWPVGAADRVKTGTII